MPDRDVHVAGGCYICNETNIVSYNLNHLAMKQAEKVSSIPNTGDHIYVLRSLSYAHHGRLLQSLFFCVLFSLHLLSIIIEYCFATLIQAINWEKT